MSTTLLSRQDVEAAIDLERALTVVERTYAEYARDRVINPPKLTMHLGDDDEWPEYDAFAIDMPGYVGWLDAAGTKWAVARWDAAEERPIDALILLFDLKTGTFEAVAEGMYLTGVRTALQSVVGIRHLLASPPGAVGVIGAGFQARFHLAVLDRLLPVERFEVFDVDPDATAALVAESDASVDADVVAVDAAGAAAENDLLITVTDSKRPVVDADAVAGTELVIALGTYRELPDGAVLAADRLVVDHPRQCLDRGALSDLADRGKLDRGDLDATIGGILEGDATGGEGGRTVFVPIGLGALDVAIAADLVRSLPPDAGGTFAFD